MDKFAGKFIGDSQDSPSEVKHDFEEFISAERLKLWIKLAESASEQVSNCVCVWVGGYVFV